MVRKCYISGKGNFEQPYKIPGRVYMVSQTSDRAWVRYQLDAPHPLADEGWYGEHFLVSQLEKRAPMPEELDMLKELDA